MVVVGKTNSVLTDRMREMNGVILAHHADIH
jgi:hypothetical protein